MEKNNKLFMYLIWILEGALVGFGVILPGVSGGVLCVAFGMYRPILETVSDFRTGLKKYGAMLVFFVGGAGLGFVLLSGLAAWLLEWNASTVTCAFVGLILGTFPELWADAGEQGRDKKSIVVMCICFVVMLCAFSAMKTNASFSIPLNFGGYLLSGLIWGMSFVVPGLSSSTLLLLIGTYQALLAGISAFDFGVIIPLGLGLVICVLLFSRAMQKLFDKYYSIMSHSIIGIVAASMPMIIPEPSGEASEILTWVVVAAVGAVVAYALSYICRRMKKNE